MYLYTVDMVKVPVISILDNASGYHVVRAISGRKSMVLQAWVSWAGAPRRVVADQERGMMKDFTDELEKRGIQVHYIVAHAHWVPAGVPRQECLPTWTWIFPDTMALRQ